MSNVKLKYVGITQTSWNKGDLFQIDTKHKTAEWGETINFSVSDGWVLKSVQGCSYLSVEATISNPGYPKIRWEENGNFFEVQINNKIGTLTQPSKAEGQFGNTFPHYVTAEGQLAPGVSAPEFIPETGVGEIAPGLGPTEWPPPLGESDPNSPGWSWEDITTARSYSEEYLYGDKNKIPKLSLTILRSYEASYGRDWLENELLGEYAVKLYNAKRTGITQEMIDSAEAEYQNTLNDPIGSAGVRDLNKRWKKYVGLALKDKHLAIVRDKIKELDDAISNNTLNLRAFQYFISWQDSHSGEYFNHCWWFPRYPKVKAPAKSFKKNKSYRNAEVNAELESYKAKGLAWIKAEIEKVESSNNRVKWNKWKEFKKLYNKMGEMIRSLYQDHYEVIRCLPLYESDDVDNAPGETLPGDPNSPGGGDGEDGDGSGSGGSGGDGEGGNGGSGSSVVTDTDPVNKDSIYHESLRVPEPHLHIIMRELLKWLENTATGIPNLWEELDHWLERIYLQLLQDNSNTNEIICEVEKTARAIMRQTRFKLEELNPLLYYTINGIAEIAKLQCCWNNSFIPTQNTLYEIIREARDTGKEIDKIHFTSFVNQSVENYLELQSNIADHLDSETAPNRLQRALYTYLLQLPSDTEFALKTSTLTITEVYVAIQNNRIYPDRELTLCEVGDCANVLKNLNLFRTIHKITHKALGLESANTDYLQQLMDLLQNFLKTGSLDLVGELLAMLKIATQSTEEMTKAMEQTTQITASIQNVSKEINGSVIESASHLLDRVSNRFDKISDFLSSLQITPNYEFLDKALGLLESAVGKFNEMLSNNAITNAIAGVVNKINEVVDLINKANDTINNALCVIQQALCVVGGWLNFKDTVIGPMLSKIKALADEVVGYFDSVVGSIMNIVKIIERKINEVVYRAVELQLIAMGPDVGKELGVTADSNWYHKWGLAVDVVILQLLGQDGPSIQELVTQTENKINDLKNSFESALNSTNCPPIKLPDASLQLPKLNLMANIPSVKKINFDLKC